MISLSPLAHGQTVSCFDVAPLNQVCCPRGSGSSCINGGVPSVCSADCADVFITWYAACRSTLSTVGVLDMTAYDNFNQMCTAISSGGSGCSANTVADLEDAQRTIATLRRAEITLRSAECCENNTQWGGRFLNSAVCGFSPRDTDGHSCLSPQNWQQAEDTCVAAGGRLCTAAELQAGEASSTGCRFDGQRVWSKSSGACGPGFAISSSDSPSTTGIPTAECTNVLEMLPVRCCADFCGDQGVVVPATGPVIDCTGRDPCIPPPLPPPSGPGYTHYGTDPSAYGAPPPPSAKNVLMLVCTPAAASYPRHRLLPPPMPSGGRRFAP